MPVYDGLVDLILTNAFFADDARTADRTVEICLLLDYRYFAAGRRKPISNLASYRPPADD